MLSRWIATSSLHSVPWALAAVTALPLLVQGYRTNNPTYTKAAAISIGVAVLLSWWLNRFVPRSFHFQRYRDIVSPARSTPSAMRKTDIADWSNANENDNNVRLLHSPSSIQKSQPHFVGLREIIGGNDGPTPALTIYYPTDTKPDPHTLPKWLPRGGDVKYAEGVARYSHLPEFLLRHTANSFTVDATKNAPFLHDLSSTAGRTLGTDRTPVIVLSHGLSGCQSVHTSLALDLASRGAVIVSIGHNDGSASHGHDANHATGTLKSETKLLLVGSVGGEKDAQLRQTQVQQRSNDFLRTLSFIATGGLCRALQLPVAQCDIFVARAQRQEESLFGEGTASFATASTATASASRRHGAHSHTNPIPSAGSITIHACGHSFGGATALLACTRHGLDLAAYSAGRHPPDLQHSPLVHQQSHRRDAFKIGHCFLFDAWNFPVSQKDGLRVLDMLEEVIQIEEQQTNTNGFTSLLPTFTLYDSEAWTRWAEHQPFKEALLKLLQRRTQRQTNGGGAAQSAVEDLPTKGVDHISCTDFGVILQHPWSRKKYKTQGKDRRQIYEWSDDIWRKVSNKDHQLNGSAGGHGGGNCGATPK